MKLKNLFYAFVALVCVTAVPAVAQENTEAAASTPLVLTLDEALQIALSENPTVKIADQTIEKKKYAKKGTYAALWPEISASATYQRYIKKQRLHFGGNDIEVGTANNISAGVNAAMPVVNVQLWKSLKLSAMDVELAVEQARSSRIDMVEQVSKAFYQVLLAKDSYDVYKRVYDNAVENHRIVEKRYSVGQVSEYDFIRSQVSVANAEPNVFNAENSIVLALWQLKALLGVDLAKDVDCKGKLSDYEVELNAQVEMGDLSENSTMKQFDIQEDMLTKALEIKRAANLPTLALSLGYNYIVMNETLNFSEYKWNPYSVAAFSLNIPIFAGGKRRAEINQAKIDLNSLQLQRENTERQLRTAMMSYYSNMLTNVKQFHASSQTISQAKRGYEIAVKRYEVGGGTLVDVDNSQLAYTQAELTRSTAIYNYLTNQVSMAKIMGTTAAIENQEN
ncbi:MAG: TolC family protein [Rikenellaceae bacterium]|nr:TolC family protein [Rikenellaceae bacterium]